VINVSIIFKGIDRLYPLESRVPLNKDIIIIGAGPAGLAAGIQLKRFGYDPLVFEKGKTGGLLHSANLVENYPGYPQGIKGRELAALMKHHSEAAGVRIQDEDVTDLSRENASFRIITRGNDFCSDAVIIASGTKPAPWNDIGIPQAIRESVVSEIGPLLDLKKKYIAILGGGDAAFDYALNLSRQNTVFIINRNRESSCIPLLKERVLSNRNITVHSDTVIMQLSSGKKGGMDILCRTDETQICRHADFLLTAIGREPDLAFLKDRLPDVLDDPMLLMAGDVKNGICRQAAIAAGDGVMAAMTIHQRFRQAL
jgi:thioredoxin reductase